MLVRMVRLERLRADHASALLAFERANRAYFARSIPDRGDAYFAEFPARHRALLAEQAAGLHHFHVVLAEGTSPAEGTPAADGAAHGELIARVNLVDVADGAAELGYRVAEHAAGRGVARAAVTEVCRLAAERYGLAALTAVATLDNPASQAVLRRTGFAVTGPTTVDDRPALRYHRPLTGHRPASVHRPASDRPPASGRR